MTTLYRPSPLHRHYSCSRKNGRYNSAQLAKAEAWAAADRNTEPRQWWEHYQCPYCGYFHIGHRKGTSKKRKRAALGGFDITLLDAIGERAYGHGEMENVRPAAFHRWMTENVPRVIEKRRRAASQEKT